MTRRKRDTTSEEKDLFRETFRDARVLKKSSPLAMANPEKPPKKSDHQPIPVPSHASETSRGLDGRTSERLRRGLLEPQSRLDLHGMTEDAAHRALTHFIRSAYARSLRLLIVVTGKGRTPQQPDEAFDMELNWRSRGVLKTMVPRWLAEPELASYIADVRSAHRRHGGAGALYVYLRKKTRPSG